VSIQEESIYWCSPFLFTICHSGIADFTTLSTFLKPLSRVARGNLTPRPSQIRTWTSRFIRLLSAMHLTPFSIKPTQKEVSSSQFLVGWVFLRADSSPSLHLHYRDFITTTGWSAPVPCLGTLTLVGPPLEFLPCHQDDRFPCSVQEPKTDSRHLYAGPRPGSKQVSPGLFLV